MKKSFCALVLSSTVALASGGTAAKAHPFLDTQDLRLIELQKIATKRTSFLRKSEALKSTLRRRFDNSQLSPNAALQLLLAQPLEEISEVSTEGTKADWRTLRLQRDQRVIAEVFKTAPELPFRSARSISGTLEFVVAAIPPLTGKEGAPQKRLTPLVIPKHGLTTREQKQVDANAREELRLHQIAHEVHGLEITFKRLKALEARTRHWDKAVTIRRVFPLLSFFLVNHSHFAEYDLHASPDGAVTGSYIPIEGKIAGGMVEKMATVKRAGGTKAAPRFEFKLPPPAAPKP